MYEQINFAQIYSISSIFANKVASKPGNSLIAPPNLDECTAGLLTIDYGSTKLLYSFPPAALAKKRITGLLLGLNLLNSI